MEDEHRLAMKDLNEHSSLIEAPAVLREAHMVKVLHTTRKRYPITVTQMIRRSKWNLKMLALLLSWALLETILLLEHLLLPLLRAERERRDHRKGIVYI